MKRFLLNLASVSFTLLVAVNVQAAGKTGGGSGGSSSGAGPRSVSSGAPKATTFQNQASSGQVNKVGSPSLNLHQNSGQTLNKAVNTQNHAANLNQAKSTGLNLNKTTNIANQARANLGQGVNKNLGQGTKNSGQQLRSMMRTNHNTNYHLTNATKRSFGYCYTGNHHNHWSYCYFDSRYNCNLYYDPCTVGYFYWCPTDICYYPVSYVPYNNYCDCSTVIDTTCPVVPYQAVCEDCQAPY